MAVEENEYAGQEISKARPGMRTEREAGQAKPGDQRRNITPKASQGRDAPKTSKANFD